MNRLCVSPSNGAAVSRLLRAGRLSPTSPSPTGCARCSAPPSPLPSLHLVLFVVAAGYAPLFLLLSPPRISLLISLSTPKVGPASTPMLDLPTTTYLTHTYRQTWPSFSFPSFLPLPLHLHLQCWLAALACMHFPLPASPFSTQPSRSNERTNERKEGRSKHFVPALVCSAVVEFRYPT